MSKESSGVRLRPEVVTTLSQIDINADHANAVCSSTTPNDESTQKDSPAKSARPPAIEKNTSDSGRQNADRIGDAKTRVSKQSISTRILKKLKNAKVILMKPFHSFTKPTKVPKPIGSPTELAQAIASAAYTSRVTASGDTADSYTHHRQNATSNVNKQHISTSILKKAKVLSLSNGKEVYVSYWDLGGDEIYYATHHIHLSPDAVYVCVFDMSKMENEDSRRLELGMFKK